MTQAGIAAPLPRARTPLMSKPVRGEYRPYNTWFLTLAQTLYAQAPP
jgi:hypothetical protein